jgi:hypothetical protein
VHGLDLASRHGAELIPQDAPEPVVRHERLAEVGARLVKASAFMHPLGANRAYEFLADVSLGREPALH